MTNSIQRAMPSFNLSSAVVFNASLPTRKIVTLQRYSTLSKLEKDLAEGMIRAMQQVMACSESARQGVWYPDDLVNKWQKMPVDYWSGHLDPLYFLKTGKFTWILKEGASAAKAIEALFKGPSVLECGNAVHACAYKALLDTLGEEKFEILCASPQVGRLAITKGGAAYNDNLLYSISQFSHAASTSCHLSVGEDCHIAGVPFYQEKHPTGFGGGWNVIYSGKNSKGEPLFIGHGFDRPLTEMEIIHKLIDMYNQERTVQDDAAVQKSDSPVYDKEQNPRLKKYYTLAASDMQFLIPYLKQMGTIGFKTCTVKSFNVASVADLIETFPPINTAHQLERAFDHLHAN